MKIERIAIDCVCITIQRNKVHIEGNEAIVFLNTYDALDLSDALTVESMEESYIPVAIESEIGQEWV